VIEQGVPADRIDTSRPHPARIYDFLLGGRDNYEVDRDAARRLIKAAPDVRSTVRSNRVFLRRATRFVIGQGIRQVIDVGTGIPTPPNVHEIASGIAPGVRVVYVDNDPIVGAHAQARLAGTENTAFGFGDVRKPEEILDSPAVRSLIDLGKPVALFLVAILHFVTDDEDPARIVRTFRDALPVGSYLVLSHGTADFYGDLTEAVAVYRNATASMNLRTGPEINAYFDGLDLVDPGMVRTLDWRPDNLDTDLGYIRNRGFYAGVALKRGSAA
jgi:hypothetical protein